MFLWQSVAVSTDESGTQKARARWKCSAIVAGVVLVGTAAGVYWHSFTHSDPTPVRLSPRAEPTVVVPRDELELRVDALDLLMRDGRPLRLALKNDSGATPELKLFDKTFFQGLIAARVREKLQQKHPGLQLPPGEGIRIRIPRLVIREVAGRPDVVMVSVGGDFMELEAVSPIAKARLLSGNVVDIDLAPFREPVEGDGEAVVEAKVAVRFDPTTGALEVVEGMSSFRVTVPGRCNERDVAQLGRARTAPFLAPRPK